MRIAIAPAASEPPFAQVRSQLATGIRDGTLPPGTRLPPVRRLAGDLGLAPNTVARAYRELERDGYIETRGRHGTYVADGIPASMTTLDAEIAQLAAHVRRLGVPPEDVVEMLARTLDVPHHPSR
jgi:DNA-binding transcriptional regulator YhcF (GntR family)